MQNSTSIPDKVKGNGKWMAKSATTAVDEATDQLTEISDSARDLYERALKSGTDFLSKANKRAGDVVKEYPVRTAIGGVVLGFLLGASLFRRRS